jgi:molybdopterin synthase catalytic subunit
MNRFSLHQTPLDPPLLQAQLRDPACGGYVAFEGTVRDHNEGRTVRRLEYEAFAPLALREGERILSEACQRFGLERACCAHRIGPLQIGELAVWVGVGAVHRGEAFDACRYIIDHVKQRVPIWKKEYYEDGDSGWVNCEQCAHAATPHRHGAHE